jgi:hypothetical protein
VSSAYSDIDRLIIERWSDVAGLIESHRETQNRMEEMIDTVGDRLGRWARAHDYEIETEAKWAEFKAAKSSWVDRRRGPRVQLAVGGFCPHGYKKMEADYPYLCLYIEKLTNFRCKEPELISFSQGVRNALGAEARSWESPDVDDTEQPLVRCLTMISDTDLNRGRVVRVRDGPVPNAVCFVGDHRRGARQDAALAT